METYHILFQEKVNHKLLEKYNASDIRTFKHFERIAIVRMSMENSEEIINEDEIISVEIDGDDVEDSSDTINQQQESYALGLMEVEKFHSSGIKGQGIKVAVFDGGIQQHEDLVISGGINGYNTSQPYDVDTSGHGTHVAGIISMRDNDLGYLGVAPECELYSVKLNSTTGGGLNRTAQVVGMEWCIANGIDVVNCSFSGSTDSSARREIFRVASEVHGIAIVCSSGNRQRDESLNKDTIGYPAKYPFVITVGNIEPDKTRVPSSSVGNTLDFVSGGRSIMSTENSGNGTGISRNYGSRTGTSMSAPGVAGLVALYKQMYPNYSLRQIITEMKDNAESLGDSWQFGAGIPRYLQPMKDIQMKERVGNSWENMFPITKAKNILTLGGDTLQTVLDGMGAEIGHTETGIYAKFENGLIVQWSQNRIQQRTNIAQGNIYRSDTHFWQLPHPVNPDYDAFCIASCSSNTRWADVSGISSSGTSYPVRQFSGNNYNSYANTNVLVVGLWK